MKAPIIWTSLILFTIFLSCSNSLPEESIPTVKNGFINLRDWDFENNGSIKLNGDWEFHWNQFLEPESTNKKITKNPGYQKIPEPWNNFIHEKKKASSHGFGTYRLLIELPDDKKRIGLSLINISTAYSLYINGKHIITEGNPGKKKKYAADSRQPQLIQILKNENPLEIILHVSNYSNYEGGINYPLILGHFKTLQRNRIINIALELFLIGCFFIIGMYHIIIYLMRRDDHLPLYFGLFCIIIAARTIVMGRAFYLLPVPGDKFYYFNENRIFYILLRGSYVFIIHKFPVPT